MSKIVNLNNKIKTTIDTLCNQIDKYINLLETKYKKIENEAIHTQLTELRENINALKEKHKHFCLPSHTSKMLQLIKDDPRDTMLVSALVPGNRVVSPLINDRIVM